MTELKIQSNSVRPALPKPYAEHLREREAQRKRELTRAYPNGKAREMYQKEMCNDATGGASSLDSEPAGSRCIANRAVLVRAASDDSGST